MNESAPDLTPELRTILDGLEARGRPGEALVAGLDFVFHNWMGLIEDGVFEDSEETVEKLWAIMESYSDALDGMRKNALDGLKEATGTVPPSMPDSLSSMLSSQEERDIHHIAAADSVRELFGRWTEALAAGSKADELVGDFEVMKRLLKEVSPSALGALRAAAGGAAPSSAP